MTNGMTLKLQYLEESFETLTSLGGKQGHAVSLVKRISDGKIFVKKVVSQESAITCQKLKGLRNRNLVQIYDTAWNDEKGIIIEEFINGITLEEYLEKWGLLEECKVCGSGAVWLYADRCQEPFPNNTGIGTNYRNGS